jgi:hypothetical protein
MDAARSSCVRAGILVLCGFDVGGIRGDIDDEISDRRRSR